jgi:hypothetical protein
MPIRYASTPQIRYGGSGSRYDVQPPAGSYPISTAPTQSAQPVIVYENDGKGGYKGSWALFHRDGWRRLSPFKDHKSGAISWRMDGTQISHPISWSPPRRGK